MAINLSKVSFAYDSPKKNQLPRYVLKDINLSISDNHEFITIVGHTGSGKSTLVQLLNALLVTDIGTVEIFNNTISKSKKIKLKEIRQKVGLVFQFPEYQLFEENILKDVCFGPKNFKLDNYEKLAKESLNKVGLDESYYEKSPFTLSGGEKRKVAIAGILASNPDVLIFDEPTAGLDPIAKQNLMDLLVLLNKEYKKTIIIITHDMEIVGSISSRVILLDKGNIIFDGQKDDLFKNSDLVFKYNLDYPSTVKILKNIKEKLNIDINEYQYNIDDAYLELQRVLGDDHG